ncbi:hypothetical protein THERMOT_1517 [Bathymodiolus thermophilus thioautotrophic gill symbiont]|nr:hypothetical protein THERMOT_1517 [Bathymodiolus thermophilus thioautotrophic gill symbiont]
MDNIIFNVWQCNSALKVAQLFRCRLDKPKRVLVVIDYKY